MAKITKTSDADNADFIVRENLVQHKPGIDLAEHAREVEASGNHQFKRSEQKDIPQRSLAERIAKITKGG